ncbi:MAG TPA: hypothetical protein VGA56_00815 [Opitutaceae bacterium]
MKQPSDSFDLLVIGSRPGGQKAAIQGAKAGLRAGVIDRERNVGGAFKPSALKCRVDRTPGAARFVVRFSVDVTITEPLYRVVSLTPVMMGRFTLRRISTLCALARRIAGELGPEGNVSGKPIPPEWTCSGLSSCRRK